MELSPDQLTNSERYKLLVGAVTPRPIAFVSSQSPEGRHNLAPFSFFNAVGSNPMALVFSPVTVADGRDKDTLLNVLPPDEGGLGEFVVNVAVEPYLLEMVACAEDLPYGESEFELTGLTPAPSRVVRPPRVVESPISFECRTLQVIRLNPGEPGGANIVIGKVVHIWVHDGVVDDGFRIDPSGYPTVGRLGGKSYTRTREIFDTERGRAALESDLPFTPSSLGSESDR